MKIDINKLSIEKILGISGGILIVISAFLPVLHLTSPGVEFLGMSRYYGMLNLSSLSKFALEFGISSMSIGIFFIRFFAILAFFTGIFIVISSLYNSNLYKLVSTIYSVAIFFLWLIVLIIIISKGRGLIELAFGYFFLFWGTGLTIASYVLHRILNKKIIYDEINQ